MVIKFRKFNAEMNYVGSEIVLHDVDPLLLAVGGDPVGLVARHHADVVGEPPLDPRVEPSDQVRPLPEIHQSVVAQEPAFGCDRHPWNTKDSFSFSKDFQKSPNLRIANSKFLMKT